MNEVFLLIEDVDNALLNTILGMLIVFLVLILISFFIYIIKFVPKMIEKSISDDKTKSMVQRDQQVSLSKKCENSDVSFTDNEELSQNKELVAVITAVIMAYLGDEVPIDGLVVRSIKRANVSSWKNFD
ncbi:OadG family protein [Anaeromicropila herbilytica]|uniref:Oxaloacetate decarboxylase gamma chain n=1 Tax=Anaeromicropila herbilytica TaxID=2785025 RepID=A0A7R7ELY5_9FIRM|nr:OadG family protein [Anaeromicropila herbilytica]BCN31331.1 hypothetical protein bsdtb5_26260 [Anaeromicropila herbilytica]